MLILSVVLIKKKKKKKLFDSWMSFAILLREFERKKNIYKEGNKFINEIFKDLIKFKLLLIKKFI